MGIIYTTCHMTNQKWKNLGSHLWGIKYVFFMWKIEYIGSSPGTDAAIHKGNGADGPLGGLWWALARTDRWVLK